MTLSKSVIALMAAVSIEAIATTLLSNSNSFQRPAVGAAAIICYCLSYYFLSIALRRIHIGVAYAIWSAVGIISICYIQARIFYFTLGQDAWIGLCLIISGTLILNLSIKKNK